MSALHSTIKSWLPDMDLNHDKQIQSLLCYRYTIPHFTAVFYDSSPNNSRSSVRDQSARVQYMVCNGQRFVLSLRTGLTVGAAG